MLSVMHSVSHSSSYSAIAQSGSYARLMYVGLEGYIAIPAMELGVNPNPKAFHPAAAVTSQLATMK